MIGDWDGRRLDWRITTPSAGPGVQAPHVVVAGGAHDRPALFRDMVVHEHVVPVAAAHGIVLPEAYARLQLFAR